MRIPESAEEYVQMQITSDKPIPAHEIIRWMYVNYHSPRWDLIISDWIVRNWAWLSTMTDVHVHKVTKFSVVITYGNSDVNREWVISKKNYPDFYSMVQVGILNGVQP